MAVRSRAQKGSSCSFAPLSLLLGEWGIIFLLFAVQDCTSLERNYIVFGLPTMDISP